MENKGTLKCDTSQWTRLDVNILSLESSLFSELNKNKRKKKSTWFMMGKLIRETLPSVPADNELAMLSAVQFFFNYYYLFFMIMFTPKINAPCD